VYIPFPLPDDGDSEPLNYLMLAKWTLPIPRLQHRPVTNLQNHIVFNTTL